ncbi:hypothetical protein GQL56_28490, partial [Pseudomonas putida]|nr:hypothetical protein [Pseudomonas putida]
LQLADAREMSKAAAPITQGMDSNNISDQAGYARVLRCLACRCCVG